MVLTRTGYRRVLRRLEHDFDGELAVLKDGSLVTESHRLLVGEEWFAAGEIHEGRTKFTGKVYNLEVEGEHEYTLASGVVAHNALK